MPEIRPILNKINAFDADFGTTLTFSWTGAQSQKNRIVIRDYDTGQSVYNCTEKTMALKHSLHLGADFEENVSQSIPYSLSNGRRYLASVYVYDVYGNESLQSSEVPFYCFTTPVFEFINFTRFDASAGIAKVNANSIYLNVKYQQENGEVISEYKFTLYDYNNRKLMESGIFYGSTADDNLQYSLGGIAETEKGPNGELNYNTCYRITCEAMTIHGMRIMTEQRFVVQKDTGGVGSLVTAEALPDHTIAVSSHFKIVNASLNGEEIYLNDSDGQPYALDLSKGAVLSYFDGFNMSEPWAIRGIIGNCQPNTVLMTCSNSAGESFTVSYIVKKYPLSEKAYFLLEADKGAAHYLLRSNYLPIISRWYMLYIKYEDGYYTFRVYDTEDARTPDSDTPQKEEIL